MTSELAGKRVLVVARATTLHANAGGMETSAGALIAALHELGMKTALVTTTLSDGTFPSDYQDHEHIWTIPTRRPGRYSRAWWRRARWTGPWAGWRPDIVLGIGDAARMFASGRHRSPVPVVTHAHGTPVMEMRSAAATHSLRGLSQAALNAARVPSRARHFHDVDLVLAAGPAIGKSVLKAPFGVAADRLAIVANSVSEEVFRFDASARRTVRSRLGVPEDAPLYLFLGRLAADKGIQHCIEAVSRLERGYLVIVGHGPIESALRNQAGQSLAADRIVFAGRVPSSESAAWLSAADQLWLLSDRREGLPVTLLEAAANGLPVLTSPTAAAPEELVGLGISVVPPTSAAEHASLVPLPTRGSYLPPTYSSSTLAPRVSAAIKHLIGTPA